MMKRLRQLYFLSGLFLFTTVTAQVNFDAKVSKKRLGLNERLRVDFVMNENGDDFTPPDFKGFTLVGGPNRSLSNIWENGKRSFSLTITYFLQPQLKGNLTIGQATVKIKGETYKTSPVTIEVTSAVKKPNDPNNVDYIVDENVHLVAEVSKSNPYLNEGITVVYKLYFRNPISISDVRELESPEFSNFWSHQVKIDQIRAVAGSYKGEAYNEVVWRKMVLYPQKTGKSTFEPLTLNMTIGVPSNRRDIFGDRIYQQVQRTITAGKRTINVKPLPEQGKPAGFTGAVGTEFNFDVILNKDALKASESFQAKVKVSGSGNLKLFTLPELSTPNTLEVYEPEHHEKVRTSMRGMLGSIEDVYTVVPQFQGKYPIPPLNFSYFNPKTKEYKTLRSQELVVNVFEGPVATSGTTNAPTMVAKQPIGLSEGSFRFIDLNTALLPVQQNAFWHSRLFYILLLLPLVLVFFFALLKRFGLNKTEDLDAQRQQRAQQLAKKYLSSAKKAMGQKEAFYDALERALHNYLKARLHIETTEMSKQKIESLLLEKGAESTASAAFVRLLENCEIARYARGSDNAMSSDFKAASSTIARIDKQL